MSQRKVRIFLDRFIEILERALPAFGSSLVVVITCLQICLIRFRISCVSFSQLLLFLVRELGRQRTGNFGRDRIFNAEHVC